MRAQGLSDAEWRRLGVKVAELSGVEVGEVGADTRLVEDLGLDSLALAELVVLLIDEYGMVGLYSGLETRSWADTTLGQLFAEAGRPAAGARSSD